MRRRLVATLTLSVLALGIVAGPVAAAPATDANGRKANIIATDIDASNGVIHVIDRVILPKM